MKINISDYLIYSEAKVILPRDGYMFVNLYDQLTFLDNFCHLTVNVLFSFVCLTACQLNFKFCDKICNFLCKNYCYVCNFLKKTQTMAKSECNHEVRNPPVSNKPYISCIRIQGLRILPPILSQEKRLRMQYYKDLAIKVEERIKLHKLKRLSADSVDDSLSAIYSSSISDSVIYSSDEEPTFKSQIFSESCRLDVLKMLNDSPKTAIKNVPLKNSEASDTNKCLNNFPEKILTPKSNSDINEMLPSNIEKINAVNEKIIFYEKSDISFEGAGDHRNNCLDENKNESVKIKSPPLLIRSNSYTLDAPSPFLLAFMKQNKSCTLDIKTNEANSKKRRTWDLEKAKEKWTSIEHDLNIVADKNSGHKRNENFNSLPNSSAPSPDIKMFDNRLENYKRSDSIQFPEKLSEIPISESPKQLKRGFTPPAKNIDNSRFIKSFVTPLRSQNPEKDVRVVEKADQHPKKTNETIKKTDLCLRRSQLPLQRQRKISYHNMPKKGIVLPKKPEIISCNKSEEQIRHVIDKIHSEQSKKMADLIARQKKEQEVLMKLFGEQQALVLSKLKSTYRDTQDETNETSITKQETIETRSEIQHSAVSHPDILKNSENLLYECKKLLQRECLSPSSEYSTFSTNLSSSDDTMPNDLTLKSCTPSPKNTNLNVETLPSLSRVSHSYSIDSLDPLCNGSASKTNKSNRTMNCSRQLFPTKQQIWAATKINALARGYLVRRLIKTERVQNLIKTIRDTLLCAMQLHHETADKILPADVELHRRLIQQVTAACYSFHDTFFELSKSEQLSIIATDRDRQKEKLLRPVSAKSNGSLSSTTQKVLERKMRRSSDSASVAPSRSSSSRSSYSANEFRIRTKSLGLSDSMQSNKKTSPPTDVMSHAMSYGANKKPWR